MRKKKPVEGPLAQSAAPSSAERGPPGDLQAAAEVSVEFMG